jgi:hypothetical protein
VVCNQIGGISCKKKFSLRCFPLFSVVFSYLYFMVLQFSVEFLIFGMSDIDLILQCPKLFQERSELFNLM